jgi:anti-anti-sigma factor
LKIVKRALDNSIIILDITGQVSLGESAQQLSAELARLLADEGVEAVILSMENINYMDSTGLGEVVGYLSRFKGSGKRLRLVKPNKTVQKLMELTRLNELIQIYTSEEEALEDIFK